MKKYSSTQILNDLTIGDHLVIGSRHRVGKSTLGLNLLSDIVEESISKSILFSFQRTSLGFEQDFPSLANAIQSQKVFMQHAANLTVSDMEKRIANLRSSGHDIRFAAIDYIQIISTFKKYTCRRDEIIDITAQLKRLAVNQNIIVISLAQLNRGIEGRNCLRPRIEDIREFSDYRYLDKVVLMHRPSYYVRSDIHSPLELIVAKNRSDNLYTYIADTDLGSLKISNLKKVTSRKL